MEELDLVPERVLYLLAALAGVALAGTLGYHWIEGWGLFDSLYMTVITIATVGYGETHPLGVPGRAFTILLILVGIGLLTYAVSTLTAFIVEGSLRDVLRRRRMETKIAKLSNHYIVCGVGHTGQAIIEELQKTHRPFVVVDREGQRVAELSERGILALQGDATTEDSVLLKAGIERARGLFGALPADPDNAFVALSARGLNPRIRIVCKQEEAGSGEKLRRSGADAVIHPTFIGGLRMASEMIRPATVGFLDAMLRAEGKVFRMEEVVVPEASPLRGRLLEEIKGSEGDAALVVAVKPRGSKSYELNPPPARRIEAGETLVAMGSIEDLRRLEEKVGV